MKFCYDKAKPLALNPIVKKFFLLMIINLFQKKKVVS